LSLVVISLPTEERALVCVDTLCTPADGSAYTEVGKMLLLPYANAVIAGIGSVLLTRAAFQWAMRPRPRVNFDVLAQGMRSALDGILADRLDSYGDDSLTTAVLNEGHHVYIIGWSEAAARMKAAAFVNDPGAKEFREVDPRSWWAQPSGAPSSQVGPPTTVDAIAARACEVARYGSSVSPSLGYGGRLVIAELERDRITTVVRPCP
jgi:hypothetical protein